MESTSVQRQGPTLGEPYTEVLARKLSVYITPWLIRAGIAPNTVTFGWFFCLLVAAAAFASGSYPFLLLGAALVFFSYVLDCVDGDLARATGQTSKIGTQLEQMAHWVSNGLLLAGIAYGLYRETGHTYVWVLATLAIIGDYTFFFLYSQLHLAANRELDYGFLHPITRFFYILSPPNLNVFILGAVFDHLLVAMVTWMVIAHVGWLLVFFLYYQAEMRDLEGRTAARMADATSEIREEQV